MQVVHKNEDERSSHIETDSIDIAICARRISRYLERKHVGRLRRRITEI